MKRSYNLKAPKGVNGRNSDNTLIEKLMDGRPPSVSRTAWRRPRWIHDEMTSGKASVVNALPRAVAADNDQAGVFVDPCRGLNMITTALPDLDMITTPPPHVVENRTM